jgi:ketosteroid isomerase-like protein
VMASFAPDPDVVVIGTGGDERGVGFAEVKGIFERAFSQFDEAFFDFGWHSVSVAGSLALLATDIALRVKTGDREVSRQIRLTCVMEKRGDEWLVLQSHDSVPDREQAEGQAFSSR